MTRLAGKVALVTGAADGIGAGIARRFGAEGAAVIVHHADDPRGAARVVAEIVWRGGRAIAVQGDIARWPDVRRLYEEIAATFGRLDILVNNGALARSEVADVVSEDELHRQRELKVFGAMLLCQEAVRMFGVAGGSIVNLTALDGIPTAPASLPDPGTDAAIDAMTRGLSRAYGTRNVRVSTIAPGMLGPEEPAAIDVLDGSVRNRQFIALPAARNHTTEGIADIAVALTCDDNAYRSGRDIMVAGAMR
jgi:3-oxoacyl-[acyl-carrier protein] reductase